MNIRVPDKKFYAAQKEEDFSRLNDVKFRRENQFKEKRIVDNDLREVNKQVQTKVNRTVLFSMLFLSNYFIIYIFDFLCNAVLHYKTFICE